MQFWLVKQEPESYSWSDFEADKQTAWTGVRNFQARNNLRAMRKGDAVFYYHSGDERQIVGLARVLKEAYADPTATEGDWSAVDFAAVKPLKQPVTLATIKQDPKLREMPLLKNTRISVTSLNSAQFNHILSLAGTRE
jgi:predicted RNA-binding protein with PUA-like domain